ncbi:MAG: hypothetical protein MK008_06280 [Bdellovibrionales bacterium]|nr:hypothetical protein [Bdellovibrionales bacterium]
MRGLLFSFIVLCCCSSWANSPCTGLFSTSIEIFQGSSNVFTKKELKKLTRYAKSGPPAKELYDNIGWHTPIKAEGFISLHKGNYEFVWNSYNFIHGYPKPTNTLFYTLEKAVIESVIQIIGNLKGGSEFFENKDIMFGVSIIKYNMNKRSQKTGIELHTDGANFHGTILLEKPKRGRGGNLILEHKEDSSVQFNSPYRVNQINVFNGLTQFHGFSPYNLEASQGVRRDSVERVLVGVFFIENPGKHPRYYKDFPRN